MKFDPATGQPVVAGVVGQADVVVGMVEPMGVEMGMRKIGANGTPAKKPYVIALLTLIGAALASRIDVEKARADVAPSLTKRQHGGEAGVAVAIGGTEIAV